MPRCSIQPRKPAGGLATGNVERATRDQEESLHLVGVSGTIAGQPAYLDGPDKNVHFSWRTLADERYYLDTGALDNIELE
jgi:hypothetical protein